MAGSFVIDTSISLKWFLDDEEDRDASVAILKSISLDNQPVVPWLWFYEMGNAIIVAIRRKRVTPPQAQAFLVLLGDMPIEVDAPDRLRCFQLTQLALQYGLTNYDAAYLELALRLKIPLVSNDKALIRAATLCNVKLLP